MPPGLTVANMRELQNEYIFVDITAHNDDLGTIEILGYTGFEKRVTPEVGAGIAPDRAASGTRRCEERCPLPPQGAVDVFDWLGDSIRSSHSQGGEADLAGVRAHRQVQAQVRVQVQVHAQAQPKPKPDDGWWR